MSITPAHSSPRSSQEILAQYQSATRTAAAKAWTSTGTRDSATFGAQAKYLADIASGVKPGNSTGAKGLSFIDRLPPDPKKLERLAQRIESQVARLEKSGKGDQATTLSAIADAIRQRAKVLTTPPAH